MDVTISAERDGDPQEDWSRVLIAYVDLLRSGKPDIISEFQAEAAAFFWLSVFKLNSGLEWIEPLASLPDEAGEMGEIIGSIVGRIRECLPLIETLRDCLPDHASKRDTVVTYGEHHERSWSNVVLAQANTLLILCQDGHDAGDVARAFSLFGYDPKHVARQLEIEHESFRAELQRPRRGRLVTVDDVAAMLLEVEPKTLLNNDVKSWGPPDGKVNRCRAWNWERIRPIVLQKRRLKES